VSGSRGHPASRHTYARNLLKTITFGHSVKGDSFIPELIAYYQRGQLPLDRLVRTYPMSQINQAIRDQQEGECVKVVLLPGA
jgi:aryl-alcohol dehydrogenase